MGHDYRPRAVEKRCGYVPSSFAVGLITVCVWVGLEISQDNKQLEVVTGLDAPKVTEMIMTLLPDGAEE